MSGSKPKAAGAVKPSPMRPLALKSVRRPEYLLITDPGPDPDDVKAILVLAMLHVHKEVLLRGVVCNGGGQPEKRARLARALLDQLGVDDEVPVGIGSQGKPYTAQPHEYDLAGFEGVGEERLMDGAALVRRLLNTAGPHSLTVVCISSLRDLADAMVEDGELVRAKVRQVAVQGGLEGDESAPHGWKPDTSVNNGFDPEGARIVYDFCFERGVPMTVTSRDAVPLLPMQLAKSFADRTDSDVMRYLANAQFLGLEGLWRKLCEGKLPARCTKQWYFATFCGVDAAQFAKKHLDSLDASANIKEYLNGYVKPYDVLALMTVLPFTRAIFAPAAEHVVNGVGHMLFLSAKEAPDIRHVLKLLRDTYHRVLAASAEARLGRERVTRRRRTPAAWRGGAKRRERLAERFSSTAFAPSMRHSGGDASPVSPATSNRPSADTPGARASHAQPGLSSAARSGALFLHARRHDGVLSDSDARDVLDFAVAQAQAALMRVTQIAGSSGVALFLLGSAGAVLSPTLGLADGAEAALTAAFILATQLAIPVVLLALHPIHSHLHAVRVFGVIFVLMLLYSVFFHGTTVLQLLGGSASPGTCLARSPRLLGSAWVRAVAGMSGLNVVANLLCAAWLLRRMCTAWRQPKPLLRALWLSLGIATVASALYYVVRNLQCDAVGFYADIPAVAVLLHQLVAFNAAALGSFLIMPFSRRYGQSLLAKAACSQGRWAGLAPLIGLGSDLLLSTERAVHDARDVCRPVELSDDILARISFTLDVSVARQVAFGAWSRRTPRTGKRSARGNSVDDDDELGEGRSRRDSDGSSVVTDSALPPRAGARGRGLSGLSSAARKAKVVPAAPAGGEQGTAPAPADEGTPCAHPCSPLHVLSAASTDAGAAGPPRPGDCQREPALARHCSGSSAASCSAASHRGLGIPAGVPTFGRQVSKDGSAHSGSHHRSPMRSPVRGRRQNGLFQSVDSVDTEGGRAARSSRSTTRGGDNRRSDRGAGLVALARVHAAAALYHDRDDVERAMELIPRAAAGEARPALSHQRPQLTFDAYIVHTWHDNPTAKKEALVQWSARFAAAHGGRAPRVWIDALCADPSLTAAEQLAHMPAHLARAERLVVLLGANLCSRMWFAAELYAWLAMLGAREAIEIVPVAQTASEAESLLAAIDTFHIMNCHASNAAHEEALLRSVELATVSRYNEVVRDLLPLAKTVCAAPEPETSPHEQPSRRSVRVSPRPDEPAGLPTKTTTTTV